MKIKATLHPRAVKTITENRKAKTFFAVDPQLVGPSGIRGELDPAEVSFRMLLHPNPFHMGSCFFTTLMIDDLVRPIGDVGSKRKAYFGFLFFKDSFKQRLIGSSYPLGPKEVMHPAERFLGKRNDDEAGSVHIQAVGCTLNRRRRDEFSYSAFNLITFNRSRDLAEVGRLVDDEKMLVPVHGIKSEHPFKNRSTAFLTGLIKSQVRARAVAVEELGH